MAELNPIDLQIDQPVHGQIVVGSGAATTVNVPLAGRIVATSSANAAALFRKWYSSLAADPLGTSDQLTASLAAGSHTITYTVKDQNEDGVPAGQLEALFKSVTHMGAGGGPPDPPPADGRPCVVHVLVANLLTPANNANLSKANAVLEAQAPLHKRKNLHNSLARCAPYRQPRQMEECHFFHLIGQALFGASSQAPSPPFSQDFSKKRVKPSRVTGSNTSFSMLG